MSDAVDIGACIWRMFCQLESSFAAVSEATGSEGLLLTSGGVGSLG